MRSAFYAFVLALFAAAPAFAQGLALDEAGAADRPLGVYAGVEPGEARNPPAIRRLARRQAEHPNAAILTWPGFTQLGDGSSRFFVQTTRPVAPELRTERTRVVVLFRNTSIHVRNSGRWLETQFFNTPVRRARLERRGRDMAFVLYMRSAATPRLSTEAAANGGFHYVYLDFGPGNYAPAVAPPPGVDPSGPPPAPAREVDPTMQSELTPDSERPPPIDLGN